MEAKRHEAHRRRHSPRDAAAGRRASLERERAAAAAAGEANADVIPWLRQLGFRLEEARRAAAACTALAGAPLEERVRHAIRCLAQPAARCGVPDDGAPA